MVRHRTGDAQPYVAMNRASVQRDAYFQYDTINRSPRRHFSRPRAVLPGIFLRLVLSSSPVARVPGFDPGIDPRVHLMGEAKYLARPRPKMGGWRTQSRD